jgi:hypothetical protein
LRLCEKHVDKHRYVDIPDVYKSEAKEAFDEEEMNRLYQLGYETGQQKNPWQKEPPGLQRYIEKQAREI